jgi:Family of unknown function (DUF6572)
MSIDQTNVIDLIGTNPTTNEVLLGISDHLEWANDEESDNEHMYLLQQKINSYLEFMESGEIYKRYPGAVGKRVTILVSGKFPMNREAFSFFEKVKEVVRRYGYDLQFQNLP